MVQFKNDVRITPDELFITNQGNQNELRITDSGLAFINGQSISLNANQQQNMASYVDALRVHLPQVANIALDGIQVAGATLNDVATTFELPELTALTKLLEDVKKEVHDTFYQQGAFVMGEQTFDDFGRHFEQRFETVVEKAMMQSVGSIMMSIGSQMIGSGGDINTFAQRMEKMGQQIEEKVHVHAQSFKHQTNALCDQFTTMAGTESELHQQIPQFSDFQLLVVGQ